MHVAILPYSCHWTTIPILNQDTPVVAVLSRHAIFNLISMDMIEKSSIIHIMDLKDTAKQVISHKVKRRIIRKGRGSVFSIGDFSDIGSRAAIELILVRLTHRGTIRRIARGLYDYPIVDPDLGMLSPSVEAITSALAGAGKLRLQPSGAYAANILGLSEQVPMRIVFLTDGASRRILVGGREIILKRTTPKNMSASERLGGSVIQALRYLGARSIDDNLIVRLRAAIPREKRAEVLKDATSAPSWIRVILQQCLADEGDSE